MTPEIMDAPEVHERAMSENAANNANAEDSESHKGATM
jgi:hypothetical protein